jgi:hypothetical protein
VYPRKYKKFRAYYAALPAGFDLLATSSLFYGLQTVSASVF